MSAICRLLFGVQPSIYPWRHASSAFVSSAMPAPSEASIKGAFWTAQYQKVPDMPDLIDAKPCGANQQRPVAKTLTAPAHGNASIPVPVGGSPAVAGLHDQIETWVNEGGAGDDLA